MDRVPVSHAAVGDVCCLPRTVCIAGCGVPELTDQLPLGELFSLSPVHPFLRSGSMSCLSVPANHVRVA